MTRLSIRGFEIFKARLDPAAQRALIEDLRPILRAAPLVRPDTPMGKPMSVRMSAAGSVGWVSDRSGYRYAAAHPQGTPWPAIPSSLLDLWADLAGVDRAPDSCLINYYDQSARMGLHQDKDEADFNWPVLSVSLGDDALFRMGNPTRGGGTDSHWLQSGDVVLMAGPARLAFHGVDRIRSGSSRLLPKGGRINLTLRVAT